LGGQLVGVKTLNPLITCDQQRHTSAAMALKVFVGTLVALYIKLHEFYIVLLQPLPELAAMTATGAAVEGYAE
jgi:hypothetical protein